MTSWQQFITAETGALLSWPVAVLILVLALRKRLIALFEGAAHARFKAAGFEAEWTRASNNAAADVATAVSDAAAVPAVTGLVEPLRLLAEQNPSAAILQAYEAIEYELRELLDASVLSAAGSSRSFFPTIAVREAVAKGLVPDSLISAVDGLGVLRDLVAHEDGRSTTTEQAREYVTLAAGCIYVIQQARTNRTILPSTDGPPPLVDPAVAAFEDL